MIKLFKATLVEDPDDHQLYVGSDDLELLEDYVFAYTALGVNLVLHGGPKTFSVWRFLHHEEAGLFWGLTSFHQALFGSACGRPSKWIHKNFTRWVKHLSKIGLGDSNWQRGSATAHTAGHELDLDKGRALPQYAFSTFALLYMLVLWSAFRRQSSVMEAPKRTSQLHACLGSLIGDHINCIGQVEWIIFADLESCTPGQPLQGTQPITIKVEEGVVSLESLSSCSHLFPCHLVGSVDWGLGQTIPLRALLLELHKVSDKHVVLHQLIWWIATTIEETYGCHFPMLSQPPVAVDEASGHHAYRQSPGEDQGSVAYKVKHGKLAKAMANNIALSQPIKALTQQLN